VAKYLVDELVKQPDVKLTVVVPKSDAGEITCEGWGDFNVYRLGKQGFWSFLPGTVYDIFAGKRQIRSLLRQINPDIVHFQGVTFLAASCEQPNILTIHGIAERDAIWDSRWGILRWLKWLLLKLTEGHGRRRVPHVILISEYVRKFLPAGSRIRKTWLIENPVADNRSAVSRLTAQDCRRFASFLYRDLRAASRAQRHPGQSTFHREHQYQRHADRTVQSELPGSTVVSGKRPAEYCRGDGCRRPRGRSQSRWNP